MSRPKTYQRGAADERAIIKRKIKALIKAPSASLGMGGCTALNDLIAWIDERTHRYNKRAKGMQGRKK